MNDNEPLRVAQVIGKWLGGGVESVVMNYYRYIDRSKIQFDFICDSDSTNIPYEEIEALGGKVILVPPYQKVFKYHNELKKVLRNGNYKIVHSHINTLSVFSLWAAKCAGVPIRIAHSHSTIINNSGEWKRNILKNILKHFSKSFATHYCCCSSLAGITQFGKELFDSGNIYQVNNAIDLEKYRFNKKVRSMKRKELNISEKTIVLGHLGRFVNTKNHKFIIDIFYEFHKMEHNSVLLLAGQGPLMNEVQEKVNKLNISDSVKFLGYRNDVNELYQVFDLFLLPSFYEGLPVVGIEAQAAGNICFFSDNMTKDVKVLDTTVFMSLDSCASEWASNMLKSIQNYNRHDVYDEMSRSSFNIVNESKNLEKKYLDYLNFLNF